MKIEQWKPIPGYEGVYEVSDLGRVRSLARTCVYGRRRREKVLQPRKTTRDHLAVALYLNSTRRDFQVHHLVLTTFVGPRPDGMEGCHWNDDPADNRLENLRWDTRSANVLDCVRNGNHSMANKDECPQGHPYSLENTYLHPRGSRVCRECKRIYKRVNRDAIREKSRAYEQRRRAARKVA